MGTWIDALERRELVGEIALDDGECELAFEREQTGFVYQKMVGEFHELVRSAVVLEQTGVHLGELAEYVLSILPSSWSRHLGIWALEIVGELPNCHEAIV